MCILRLGFTALPWVSQEDKAASRQTAGFVAASPQGKETQNPKELYFTNLWKKQKNCGAFAPGTERMIAVLLSLLAQGSDNPKVLSSSGTRRRRSSLGFCVFYPLGGEAASTIMHEHFMRYQYKFRRKFWKMADYLLILCHHWQPHTIMILSVYTVL